MKKCSKCKLEKSKDCFYKNKTSKDGLNTWCKDCFRKDSLERRDRKREYDKKYRENNKEKIKKYQDSYRTENNEYLKTYDKQRYSTQEYKIKKRKYDNAYYTKPEVIERNRKNSTKRIRERRHKDPIFRLIGNRRHRRNMVIKNKNSRTLEDLGCTVDEWKNYLQCKFHSNMTWENYGSVWHLDEIIPISAWDLESLIHWKACWHYLNSQPLLVKDNLRKQGANKKDYSEEIKIFLFSYPKH